MKRVIEWEARYGRKLLATDVLIVVGTIIFAQYVRFGVAAEELEIPVEGAGDFGVAYTALSALIAAVWVFALSLSGTRDPNVIGIGPSEYIKVANSTFFVFGMFAILSFASKAQIGRGYLLIALPLGLFLLLISRWLWRKRLHSQRGRGKNSYRTLILGDWAKSRHVAKQIMSSPANGFWIVGAATEKRGHSTLVKDIPIVSGFEGAVGAIDALNVDTVILTSSDAIPPRLVREIGWQLESRGVDLIVAAALTDVAGPRIHTRPVAGLPLIHVEFPTFSGPKHFSKRVFDFLVSSVLLILFALPMALIAFIVYFTSEGPVFFRQERIGLNGRPFSMFKFRSMIPDAEKQLSELLPDSEGNGVLFKMKNDPRVTRVGRVLRKYSLDELPQLVNVWRGEMSLVGPRPPLKTEVDSYVEWVSRRLLVKPGITGLWQVSGRSNLSWEDSVRLDLYYVENWSLIGDILLLLRTVRTVVRSEGAY